MCVPVGRIRRDKRRIRHLLCRCVQADNLLQAGGTRVTAQTNIFQRGLRPCAVMSGGCAHVCQPLVDPDFRNQLTYRVNSVTIVGFFSSQRPTNLTKAFTTNHPVKFHHRWQQHSVRQTVRNMVVVTVLAAGAYFAAFYIPMLSSGTSSTTEDREFDYLFHYRADQDMPGREEVLHLAEEMGVTVTRYAQQSGAVLAYDGYADVVSEGPLGATYDVVYCEETASDVFLSESAWNILTGDDLDLEPGTVATVYDRNGDSSGAGNSISLVTNHLTGEQLAVTPAEPLRSTSLLGYRVLDDGDYARITQGLPDEWREVVAVFDVEDEEDTYFFARALFDEIVDRSGPEVALFDGWDPVVRDRYLAEKGYYFLDPAHLEPNGFSPIEYDQRDSSAFRVHWKYMPSFRVLDRADFVTTMAVFLMLFLFIAIVCFAAVLVIGYTRCLTIALNNRQVFEDLRRLGATPHYLYQVVRGQVSRVFFVPGLTGTTLIYAFYMLILYFNGDPLGFSAGELAGMGNCLLLVAALSLLLYGFYRFTLGHVCRMVGVDPASRKRDGRRLAAGK